MKTVIFAAVFAVAICLSPVLSADDAVSDGAKQSERMAGLENQMAAVRGVVEALSKEVRELKFQLKELQQEAGIDVVMTCQERIGDLRKTLDNLHVLGYRPGHPDMVNVTRQLNNEQVECGQG